MALGEIDAIVEDRGGVGVGEDDAVALAGGGADNVGDGIAVDLTAGVGARTICIAFDADIQVVNGEVVELRVGDGLAG